VTKFLSIMWGEEVRGIEAGVAVRIIQELLLDLYRRHWPLGLILPPVDVRAFGSWVLQGVPEGSPYWSAQWYVEQSYDPSVDKLVGSRFLSLVRSEPWQQSDPHYDLAFVAEDLIASDEAPPNVSDSAVLGVALPGLAAVVSLHQLRAVLGARDWQLALRRLVLHYFGHVLGLPGGLHAGGDTRSHCANVCVMRNARDVEELLRQAEEEEDAGVTFCEDCAQRLKSIVVGHHFHGN
jgi:hypothetical protein